MIFELTDEHKLMRQMVREFAEAEIAPGVEERDEAERFDRTLMFDKLGELGLTGIVFPERYGGAEADYISYAIAVEELSRVSPSVPTRSTCSGARHNRKNFSRRWQKVAKWAPSA